MKILAVHNRYQLPGGEDIVFEAEVDLLRRGGFGVDVLVVSNYDIRTPSDRIAAAAMVAYNPSGQERSQRRSIKGSQTSCMFIIFFRC